MSVVEMNRNEVAGGLGHAVSRLSAMIGGWNEARATRRELNRLTDRELDDIGLSRGDIERVARGA
ncbi:DUF1127 domain-containing protein [Paracoccus sp. CPCC 101403]|uniref:DUF1127 domain-containing protein n=2 Tax=Paracoccus broussonetiae TaxID=3075834 RepID=A0ABU3EIK0_9RHOB|nr:DUF1127 domain-containing protein [Paracoccus sp. CPCC 101403]MDT1064077.1 DUF1127 domain-containing protein [Paracoccus sp. CPCC 101403]